MADTITIDGKVVELNGERNLLEVIRRGGIDLPTFCYNSELSIYGACRMCVCEEDKLGLVGACSTQATPGMNVRTNTPQLRQMRRTILEFLLANHHQDCTTCPKSGSCRLQELSNRLGVEHIRFSPRTPKRPKDDASPSIVRDPNKCILCGDCVRMCNEVQAVGALNFAFRGPKMCVGPAFGADLTQVDCINCGQCLATCPCGALTVKGETEKVWNAMNDPSKTVIAQIAPAVRVALGEEFGGKPGDIVTDKIAAAMRTIGFDKVFDTCFTADLTVIEEAHEFLKRVQKGEHLPQFTSCCPGWITYAERHCPDMLENLSSCKSPQQMFGAMAKRYYAKQLGIEPEDLYVVSVMPCTAKKFEAKRPEFAHDGVPDIDAVITTTELGQMIRQAGVMFDELAPDAMDMPFGFVSGAAVIFGASGGVAEAALRLAVEEISGQTLQSTEFKEVRGLEGVKEATYKVGDLEVRLAVVSGIANTEKLIDKVRRGEVDYHLIEVMACPGGCIGGGGQPVPNDMRQRQARAASLYRIDAGMSLKKSQDNPTITEIYAQWLGEPNSHEAHEALHTAYQHRKRLRREGIGEGEATKLEVAVCVGTNCYSRGSYKLLQSLIQAAQDAGVADQVNFRGTFCMENCDRGPSVHLEGMEVQGIKPESAQDFFNQVLMPRVKVPA